MPVTALLVSGEGPAFPRQEPGALAFPRQERATSSVRLRKRRDDVTAPGRRNERHSGDFSFTGARVSEGSESEGDWNYVTYSQGEVARDPRGREERRVMEVAREPRVQEQRRVMEVVVKDSRTCQAPMRSNLHASRAVSASAVNIREGQTRACRGQERGGPRGGPARSQERGGPLGGPRSQERGGPPSSQERGGPLGGPRSQEWGGPPRSQERGPPSLGPRQERVVPPRSQERGPPPRSQERGAPPRNQEEVRMRLQPKCQEEVRMRHQHRSQVKSQGEVKMRHQGPEVARSPVEAKCQHARRQSLQPPSSPPSHTREGNTKRCSGEFEFKKVRRRSRDWNHLSQVLGELGKAEEQVFMERMVRGELVGDSGSEGSGESGVFSTDGQESPRKVKPGLGRRAVTQVDMREVKERKNSYNSAMVRSQENLVTASSPTDEDPSDAAPTPTLRKGLLWQQRDKLFSRWKERYFILTKDLLQCFKKGTSKITEMGEFIFSIKLAEVESMELLDKRGYLTICLVVQREGKVYLRRTEAIREWYNAIREGMEESKARRSHRVSAIFTDRRQVTDSTGMDGWVAARRLGRLSAFSDSTPEVNKERITMDELSRLYKDEEEEEGRKVEVDTRANRLSMVSMGSLVEPVEREAPMDLEKAAFLRRSRADTDSGNNSLQSSTGTNSSKLSQPIESSFVEEDEEDYKEEPSTSPEVRIKPSTNTNIIEVRYRERSEGGKTPGKEERRRSKHVNRLQITNV